MKKPTLIKPNGEVASALSPAQQECIQLLESALDNARNGDITALAVVAVGPMDFGIAFAGSDAAKLYLGCGTAMRTLEARTSGGGRDTVLRR